MCDDKTVRECSQVLSDYRKAPCPQHDDLVEAVGSVGDSIAVIGKKMDTMTDKVNKLSTTTLGNNHNGRAGIVADVAEHNGLIKLIASDTGATKRMQYWILGFIGSAVVSLLVMLARHMMT